MRHAIRSYWRPVLVIVVFAVASTGLGVYILGQQRLQSPFASRYTVRVALSATPGLTPGLGQPADVAGVPVGEITDARVANGQAIVTLTIDRSKLPHVYADATANLVPNTPLQDLQIDLAPGGPPSPVLADGALVPVGQGTVPVAADQLLDALDGDTRSYLTSLLSAAGSGLSGRAQAFHGLLAEIGPTAHQVDELSSALAARRTTLAHVVHDLSVLAVAAGHDDGPIRRAVSASSATLVAMAGQDHALRQALAELPGTLADTRAALGSTQTLATQLAPTLTALTPAVTRLPGALRATAQLSATATPVLRDAVRPLVASGNRTLPLLRDAARHLTAVSPDLDNAFRVLQYALNELMYSDAGKARSYGFYAAWANHDGNSVLSTGDADGQVISSALILGCSELNTVPELTSVINGLSALLPSVCPKTAGPG